MTVRWYVMPIESVAVNGHNIRRPEFLTAINPAAPWGWLPTKEDWAIGWVDLTAGEHTTYNGSAQVLFLTDDLLATLTAGQVTGVQTRLSNRNLPSAWVDTTDNWHDVIKRIFAFIQCIQRFYGETKVSMNVGVPVTTLISSLSQANQDKLDVVATSFPGGALPAVNHATDTVETMMMRWADTLMTRPVFVSGIEL